MSETNRPLVITTSLPLIDELVRLASSAALEVHVAADISAAAEHWLTAPLVLVGSDARIDETPSRRARVVVVHHELSATSGFASPSESQQRDMWRFAVELGAEHVVELPDGDRWLIDAFRECAEGPARNGVVIPIIGGSGGVGASTLAANLAVVATREGHRSLLVDADSHGGGLDLLVGAENVMGTRWTDLKDAHGHLPSGHLDAALPRVSGVAVLSCGREEQTSISATAMASVLTAGRRSHDVVIVDCSGASDALVSAVVAETYDAVLVVGDHVRATAAAAGRRTWLRSKARRVHLVCAASPRGISEADLEHALGAPFAATVPFVPSMPMRADEGEMPALPKSYAHACRQLLQVLIPAQEHVRAA